MLLARILVQIIDGSSRHGRFGHAGPNLIHHHDDQPWPDDLRWDIRVPCPHTRPAPPVVRVYTLRCNELDDGRGG